MADVLEDVLKDVVAEPVAEPVVEPPPVKKKPGRPKKKVDAEPAEIHGLVPGPANPDDVIEMAYCNPTMFKKILQLFKLFAVSEIEMNWSPDGLHIVAKDHLQKSTIYVTVDGCHMNWFYCRAPVTICVKRDSLERVLSTVAKTLYKITFIMKVDEPTRLYVILKDIDYDVENKYFIDVNPIEHGDVLAIDDDTDYPIKFKFTSKHFKSLITNARKLSTIITIQKVGEAPLQLTYPQAQAHTVNWTGIYNDPSKIGLVSAIGPDDVFTVSVMIDYIKPFSSGIIGDDVFIAAHQTEKLSLMSQMDKKEGGYVASVKIFTEISATRPPDEDDPMPLQ